MWCLEHKMQRGTFEWIFWPIDPRKRPDARHFVWLVLMHPPCHLAFIENKRVNVVLVRREGVGIPSSGKIFQVRTAGSPRLGRVPNIAVRQFGLALILSTQIQKSCFCASRINPGEYQNGTHRQSPKEKTTCQALVRAPSMPIPARHFH